ncbi:hypothetical protein H6P81_013792 [Aristolochia fimbriata]|uniref:Protein kinase domain-containing protein n=1 Tax=Aristolochia fimbriata TaxID=158543 RepID=A0AAV7EG46_ARIFI|nr:hypothetical protein H6P81_013792 [Aristolochia fimbriata]
MLPGTQCLCTVLTSQEMYRGMSNEIPCPPDLRPAQDSSFVMGNHVNNFSLQTGEEFSLDFLKDRVPSRITDRGNDHLVGAIGFNQNYSGYEDFSQFGQRGAGVVRCSDAPSSLAAFPAVWGGDKSSYSKQTHHNRKLSNNCLEEINVDIGYSTSESGKSDSSCKLKFLCSFGGKILPRPSDGKLRYVGGETRIMSIRENLSLNELMKKTLVICSQPHMIKYQLPGEDLDALISVSSDEDLQNMMEEYQGLLKVDGTHRLRIFLISENEPEAFDSRESQNNSEYNYVVAVNGILSPRKSSSGHSLASQVGLDSAPNFHRDSPFYPLEPNDPTVMFSHTQQPQYLVNARTSPTHSPPFTPVHIHRTNSRNALKQVYEDQFYHGSCNSNSTFATLQKPDCYVVDGECQQHEEMGIHQAYRQMEPNSPVRSRAAHLHTRTRSREFVPSVLGRVGSDMEGYSFPEKLLLTERTFHSEISSRQMEDSLGQLESNDSNGLYQGMPHALSDSLLQEQSGKSAYSFQQETPENVHFAFSTGLSPLLHNYVQGGAIQSEKHVEILDPSVQHPVYSNPNDTFNHTVPYTEAFGNEKNGGGTVFLPQNHGNSSRTATETHEEHEREKKNNSPIAPSAHPSRLSAIDYHRLNGPGSQVPVGMVLILPATSDTCTNFPNNQLTTNEFPGIRDGTMNDVLHRSRDVLGGNMGKQSSIPSLSSFQLSMDTPGIVSTVNTKDDQEVRPDNSVNLSPHPLNPVELNRDNSTPWSLFQNQVMDETSKREASLCDNDDVKFLSPLVAAVGLGGNNNELSESKHSNLIQAGSINGSDEKIQVIIEDVISNVPSGVHPFPSLINQTDLEITNDEQNNNISSPKAIVAESLSAETLSEDARIEEREADESITDASLAEMEAGIYGLQIIKNADLEELRELGSGTFGTVYHGKWRGTDVAIKRIKKSCFAGRLSEQDRLTKDFWREAQILSKLHHPNVVAFYGVVPDGAGGTLATVTEFMVNGSLRHVLVRKDKALDRRKRLIIAMDAAFGMEYLHSKNIVHFDLKCDNLLVNMRDSQRPICKVGDFGLSRIKRNTLVSGGVRGTLPWMAPELLNGSSSRVSEKVDVFSFGIAMWEILTGEEPYANMHCGAIIGGIVNNSLRPPIPDRCDPEWRKLMEECWSPDPSARPSFSEITCRLRSMSMALHPKGQSPTSNRS